MKKREMIKQIYQKANIIVDEDYIDNIMENKKRVKDFMRLYKDEEIESMNYILGKDYDNSYFTKFELEALSKINLFNRKTIECAKLVWQNKDNMAELEKIINSINSKLLENIND